MSDASPPTPSLPTDAQAIDRLVDYIAAIGLELCPLRDRAAAADAGHLDNAIDALRTAHGHARQVSRGARFLAVDTQATRR